jgi:hypothetical protein
MYWIAVLLFIGLVAFAVNMGEEYFCGIADKDEDKE